MKNINIKILFLLSLLASVLSFAPTIKAAGDSLYVTPAISKINTGSNITVSAVAGTSGDKICAVQGTIIFTNLTCHNITLANGVMAQTSPTCSSPSFVLAIPKCTTTSMTLFTVSSTAGSVGTASVSFSGVKLVGVGTVVSTASESGNYTVNSLPVIQPKPTITKKTITIDTTATTQPAHQTTEQVTTTPIQQTTTATTPNTAISINTGAAALANTGALQWFNWILIIAVILIVVYAAYYFATKKKN